MSIIFIEIWTDFDDFLSEQAPRGAAPQGAAPLKGLLGQHVKAKAFFTCASPRARGNGWLHCRTIRYRKFLKFEKGECINTLPWIPSSFVVLARFPRDEIISFNNVWQLAVGFVVLAYLSSDEMISLRNHCALRKDEISSLAK